MARNPPIRTTTNLHLRMPRDAAERLKINAAALGYTESEYVATLVRGESPISRPAANMQDVALAGNRIVRAIAALAGDDKNDEAAHLLREAQRHIANELAKAQPAYTIALATYVKEDLCSNE